MEGDVNDNGVSLDAYRNNIIAYNSYEINVNEYRKNSSHGEKIFALFHGVNQGSIKFLLQK